MHIVYVGYPGFPVGHAQVERQKLIAKGLETNGCRVTVISRYGIHAKKEAMSIPENGMFEGIAFRYASGINYRPDNFLKRNYYKAKGLFLELYSIWRFSSDRNLDAVLITTNSFYNVILYTCIASLCGVPSILDNVEYWSSRKGLGFWEKLDSYLYDKYAYKWPSKVICISNFLLNIVKTGNPEKPVIKVPTIVDYAKFQHQQMPQDPYFLFCGSAVYFDIINFILEAYEQLGEDSYKLYLISNGTPDQVTRLQRRISQSPRRQSIRCFSGLSYQMLTQLYTSSKALLIPLLNRQQDIARFPHKIGEYCASGRVIVTTNIGEISSYFRDQENALIAENPDPTSFAIKMQQVIDNPKEAERIAKNSFKTGEEHFDYHRLGKKVYNFMQQQEVIVEPQHTACTL